MVACSTSNHTSALTSEGGSCSWWLLLLCWKGLALGSGRSSKDRLLVGRGGVWGGAGCNVCVRARVSVRDGGQIGRVIWALDAWTGKINIALEVLSRCGCPTQQRHC
eukprot:1158975-Pelagomonas_calceolata.AAC.11